jgi:predicted RNA-binding Zn ribbon-like protein
MAGPAELLRDFVNTLDVESDSDEISSPAELAVWLRERGLAGPGDRAGDDDLATAIALREGLRTMLRHHHDHSRDQRADPRPDGEGSPSRPASAELTTVLAALPLRVVAAGDDPTLEPTLPGVPGALARIAAAIVDARCDGTWRRLKVCGESTCQWAFIDSSKNRSRAWCSMRVCGNRTKTRAYRARRQAETGSRRA